ncbi:MAG: Tad domain-containing protein [Acidaminobacteraceae bacterium]
MRKKINFLKIKVKEKCQNNRGSLSIVNALLIASLVMIAAFVIDFGLGSAIDAKIQNAVDASALAGGLYIKESEALAFSKANEIALLNGLVAGEYVVNIDMTEKTVQVTATRHFNTSLARVFGISSGNVNASSKVKLAPVGLIKNGVKPLAVEDQPFSYGQRLVLKLNASDNAFGNFGALSLGGNGASIYRDNLLYGFNGGIAIGDVIYTNPGNMASVINPVRNMINPDPNTFDNYSRDSVRIWTIPIVDSMDVNGSSPVTVMGFAVFFIEDIGRQSGQTEITGRFIEYATTGRHSVSAGDYGLDSVMIIE